MAKWSNSAVQCHERDLLPPVRKNAELCTVNTPVN